jgi:hypothetical protein
MDLVGLGPRPAGYQHPDGRRVSGIVTLASHGHKQAEPRYGI